ncbi:hypothetical protein CK203_038542 [Vitis vinifera]|uniref:Uncharacterized protein n=1 Tax=Vitis vinifera TaxID=29760 RepID=A0A438I445_VITVI|nr:hypothetical protein CK203_038542 [Vitis vinifera]
MVSLRRRKNLGLCAGRASFLAPLPKFSENGNAPVNHVQPARPFSVQPVPSDDAKQPIVVNSAKVGPGSSNVSGSSSSKEQHSKPFSDCWRNMMEAEILKGKTWGQLEKVPQYYT